MSWLASASLALGLGLDAAFGDPEPHPLRIFGGCIHGARRGLLALRSPWAQRLGGVLLALGLPTLATFAGLVLRRWSGPWAWIVEGCLVGWFLCNRSLWVAARRVQEALQAGNLPEARAAVAQVVGRDTDELPAQEIRRAVLESLGESLCDGVVAPLCAWAIAGLPGLLAFKAISTLDSMVGHKEPPHTHLGWASARLDDLVNFIPARLTAALISLAHGSLAPLSVALRQWRRHASPNAAWGEAALATALGVRFEGVNRYDGVAHVAPTLGEGRDQLTDGDVARGLALALRVMALTAGLALLVKGWL